MADSAARLSRGTLVVPRPAVPLDGALLERARRGDDVAFQWLVERYEARVATTVIGMLGAGQEAEDVGQETFIRFYRSMDRFRGDAALGTYLTRIAINLSLTALKRRKTRRRVFVHPDDTRETPADGGALSLPGESSGVDWSVVTAPDVHEELERRMRTAQVRRAVEALKPAYRAVVVLRMFDGYSTREAAEILGVAEGTIMSRLSRAMKTLKSVLETYDEA